MIIKTLHLTILLLVSIGFFGQDVSSKDFSYKRYEGNIEGNITLTAHLVQVINQLYGNYRYTSVQDSSQKETGKTIELNGELFAVDSAKLKELGKRDFVFKGKLAHESYSGMWTSPEDEELNFEMFETYPNGSLNLEVHYLHSESMLFPDSSNSPSAEIELVLIYPYHDSVSSPMIDSVATAITDYFFGSGFSIDEPDSMLLRFEQEYFESYINQNREFYDGGSSFNWEKMITMSVVFNSNHVLCLEYLMYGYTGGAHGMTKVSYNSINLENGATLDLDNIFKSKARNGLSKLLTKQVREDLEIPQDVSLQDAGFFIDTIPVSENIYINGNGIGFLYNQYEIAPYAFGTTNILLPWHKIKHLLREESPAYLIARDL